MTSEGYPAQMFSNIKAFEEPTSPYRKDPFCKQVFWIYELAYGPFKGICRM